MFPTNGVHDVFSERLGVAGLVLALVLSLSMMGILSALRADIPPALSSASGAVTGALAGFFAGRRCPSSLSIPKSDQSSAEEGKTPGS